MLKRRIQRMSFVFVTFVFPFAKKSLLSSPKFTNYFINKLNLTTLFYIFSTLYLLIEPRLHYFTVFELYMLMMLKKCNLFAVFLKILLLFLTKI